VRSALEPLAAFAEQFNVAVLAITHPTKAPQLKAIHAATGSGAFAAAPRLLFLAINDPESQGRSLLLAAKNNIGRMAEGLGYRAFRTVLLVQIRTSSRPASVGTICRCVYHS
jgi:hypothetical protein